MITKSNPLLEAWTQNLTISITQLSKMEILIFIKRNIVYYKFRWIKDLLSIFNTNLKHKSFFTERIYNINVKINWQIRSYNCQVYHSSINIRARFNVPSSLNNVSIISLPFGYARWIITLWTSIEQTDHSEMENLLEKVPLDTNNSRN